MAASDKVREPEIRQGDLWAWAVSFVVTLGIHIGIVLFITLSIALGIYALASTIANLSVGVLATAWIFTVISLIVWGRLVKVQARGFRPHVISGVGKVVVATSGCEWGEIAADIGTALIGLAQIIPLIAAILTGRPSPEQTTAVTTLESSMFIVLGCGSLTLRLWLRHRRLRNAKEQP